MANDPQTPSTRPAMLKNLRAVWAIASPRRRLQLYATLALMVVGAIVELITIGAVAPLLALAANTDYASSAPVLRSLFDLLDLRSGNDLLVVFAVVLAAAALSSTLLRLLMTWVTQQFVFGLHHDIATRIFARALRQPYEVSVKQNSSAVVASLDKVYQVVAGILAPGVQAVTSAGIAICVAALLFIIDPLAAFVAAASIGLLYVAISIAASRTLRWVSKGLATGRTKRVKTVQESLGGLRDIILDHSQPVFEKKLDADEDDMRRFLTLAHFIGLAPRAVVEGAAIILLAVMTVWYSFQPGGALAAIPVLGVLGLGAQRLLPLLQAVYLGWSGYSVHAHNLQDVAELMNAPVSDAPSLPPGQAVQPFGAAIELKGVSFGYGPGVKALKRIDLVIPKGARVGLIGKTGSGKSTLVDVIMGLLRPTSGEILLGGEPLGAATMANWQAQIAHVPQAIFLSDDSIAANIAFGCSEDDIDMARVRQAAERADIRAFVDGLPEGFATEVGERGVRLSGGQRQRIGIARALYKQATVLILDEATSALDDETEAAIMDSVARLDRELTIVLIAHRLSTVAACDVIYRLEDGAIAQSGTYEEVVVRSKRRPMERSAGR